MMTVREIIDGVRASMKRNKDHAEQRAAIAKAYIGPERRRAPRIEIEDNVQRARRLADQAGTENQP